MKQRFILFFIGLITVGTINASSFKTDTFKTKDGGELVITFIKHGSLMLTYNGQIIQVDPVSMYADYSVFPKADIILLTHEHGDHLDKAALEKIEKENGFIVTLGGLRVYIAGDTEDIPEMKEIKDIDIAFFPVNQPYTMSIDQAVNAAKLISPKILYPYHYADTPVQQLADRLKDSGTEVRIRDMQ